MIKKEIYNPFGTKDYIILHEDSRKYFCYGNLKLELSPDCYIPKSGLLFDQILSEKECKEKDVLDLGCGYLGILSLIAYKNGARRIDAIDYDKKCVEWFNKIIKDNNFKNINCFCSDYFKNVMYTNYDLILSNPPQMPMLTDSLHDSGGVDGRKYILKIIKESLKHLKKDGNLYLLLFDFLGVEARTNSEFSLLEIANQMGYTEIQILSETIKKIKDGGVTYQNIPYINEIYPLYSFEKEKETSCKLKIIKLRK